ncbi:LysR family transcriptional regulator [Acinetobacter ihumii]|uniref:LysR family transcriptional regulator n=1 Tax=Acinetobacter ihumii TaxID=2483802 RepID=UPI00102FED21|nr:LysR family transcriptional regulator [Acinetobacter ihumii]
MDLALVRIFICVYETKNITKAADILNLSQPSVSYNLNRLRQQLNNPLFERTQYGVEPTKLAHELYPVFKRAISDVEIAIDEALNFNPAVSNKVFRLGLSDIGEICLLPVLVEYLQRHAPNIRLEIEEIKIDQVEKWLVEGFIDAAVFNSTHLEFHRLEYETLFQERYVALVNCHHPRIQGQISLQDYLAESHVAIKSTTGHTQVDHVLKLLGYQRHIALEVPHFGVLQGVLDRTELVVTLPMRAAAQYLNQANVHAIELPFDMAGFFVGIHWFSQSNEPVARQWFIQTCKKGRIQT